MNNFEGRVNTTRFDLLRKTEVRSEINQPSQLHSINHLIWLHKPNDAMCGLNDFLWYKYGHFYDFVYNHHVGRRCG